MKISKLFHWLYALLMLLPAFFVGGRMAYTIFNKNAKDSYSGITTSDIEYPTELETDKEYQFYKGTNVMLLMHNDIRLEIKHFSSSVNALQNYVISHINQINRVKFVVATNDSSRFEMYDNDTFLDYWSLNLASSCQFDFISTQDQSITNNNFFREYVISSNALDNAFDYSMSQLNELPLFSWAKDSFIVEPFTYITGLFGMPSDSPVLTLLSYWCSISLIWLTFDLLMYVPLLVHRWLDKGVLE